MDRRQFLASAAALATSSASSAGPNAPPAARAPAAPAAAANASSEVPGNVAWHDVREWGVEGRGFNDTTCYFDRLPGRAKGVVRDAVWSLSRHTSGMAAFFETDATELYVRYTLLNRELAMPHMPATGVSGVDLYGMTDHGWRWVITHLPKTQSVEAKLIDGLAPGRRAYHLNLPLYNDHVGLVEAHRPVAEIDLEEAAIEAGANEVQALTREQNDDIPTDTLGAKFICERADVATVSKWLSANGWTVVTSEIGYVPNTLAELTEVQQGEVGEFLQALDEHDDVHRVWAAVK